ncbi:MAG: hypothetical protein JST92_19870 [Deltaproteobacteria bacterium]|nr:hypothetical protein [Deltaproteobacteria bacterium]
MGQGVALSTDLDDVNAIPYFLWDDPMTVGELRRLLSTASEPERLRLLARVMREAKDTEVWKFTTLKEVVALFPRLRPLLGRRLAFWDYLLGAWGELGLLP